eukprot:COSAG01_NODE_504_length_16140_cov_40.890967_3_plen_80_part_00
MAGGALEGHAVAGDGDGVMGEESAAARAAELQPDHGLVRAASAAAAAAAAAASAAAAAAAAAACGWMLPSCWARGDRGA